MTTLAEKIAVMQAAERGEKIEYSPLWGANIGRWFPYTNYEGWNFNSNNYRVAPREMKIVLWCYKDYYGGVHISKDTTASQLKEDIGDTITILSEQTITY